MSKLPHKIVKDTESRFAALEAIVFAKKEEKSTQAKPKTVTKKGDKS